MFHVPVLPVVPPTDTPAGDNLHLILTARFSLGINLHNTSSANRPGDIILPTLTAEEFADRGEVLNMIAEDLEDGQNGKRQ